jgi:hypothetical protein
MEMEVEFKFDVDLAGLSLEGLEQKAKDYRLAVETNARLEEESKHAKELEKQQRVVEAAKAYLPASLHDRVKFSLSKWVSYEYIQVLSIDAGNWRLLMEMCDSRESKNEWTWRLNRDGFIPTSPQLYNDDERGWIVTWHNTLQGTNNLLEAIERAMDHPDITELQLEAAQRNANGIKPAVKEPEYVKDDQPQEMVLMSELITLIKDVAREVVDERFS